VEKGCKAARFCLAAFLALTGSKGVEAANRDAGSADRPAEGTLFVYSAPQGNASLLGFPCSATGSASAVVFTADPAYRETPATIGLQLSFEADSFVASPDRVAMDHASSAEAKTPLSTRLRRIVVENETAPPVSGDEFEEISLSGASKSVADLMAVCNP